MYEMQEIEFRTQTEKRIAPPWH